MSDKDSPSGTSSSTTVDGQLDCSQYSDAQLRELLALLNEDRFPINIARIRAALEERGAPASSTAVAHTPVSEPTGAESVGPSIKVQYTAQRGWRAWWAAKRERLPFFGEGTFDAATDPVALSGWCRTWLGVQTVGTRRIARSRIRNVVADRTQLSFEWRPHFIYRRLTLTCRSELEAQQLAASLPAAKTERFDEQWAAHQALVQGLERKGVRPIVTYVLTALCVAAYVGMLVGSGGWSGLPWATLVSFGANYGPLTTSGQWWRLITGLFLHAGLAHLLINMWVLWHAGRMAERLFGSARYAFIWLGSGLAASMSSVVWNPSLACVGASGPIFGVLGAFLGHALRPNARLSVRVLKTYWISTAIFVLFSLVNGFLGVGIDNAAHVGGFLSGLVIGVLLAEPLPSSDGPLEPGSSSLRHWAPVAAAVFVGVWATLGYLYVRGYGASLPPAAVFLKNHQWFLAGEAKSLQQWQDIGAALDAGAASPADIARRFRGELLPFWKDAAARQERELPLLPKDQQLMGRDMLAYTSERLALINDVIAGVERDGTIPTADIQAHVTKITDQVARVTRLRLDAEAAARPRALSTSPLMMKFRGWLGKEPTCVLPPVWTGRRIGANDDPSDGPSQRQTIRCRVQQAFLDHDFATIEQYLKQFPKEDVDPIEGWTRHSIPFDGLGDLFSYGSVQMEDALTALSAWRQQLPESDTPKLVEADLFVVWAWAARSGAYAKEVTPQQWQAFRARLVMAQAALDEAQRVAQSEPEWYDTRLTIGLGMDDTLDARLKRIAEVLKVFPLYRPMYSTMLHTIMPRWSGSYDDIDTQIKAMAANWGDWADAVYAETYTEYAYMEGDDSDFFTDGKLDWARLSAGYQALMRRYPLSNHILNEYAFMACRADRPGFYENLRSQLQARMAESAWTPKFTLKHCDELMQWNERGQKNVRQP